MVRGTGKFKQKRGGGRSFSKHLTLDENGTAVATDRHGRIKGEEGSDEDSSEDEEEKSEDEDEDDEESADDDAELADRARASLSLLSTTPAASASGPKQPELTRQQRKEQKKKQQQPKQQTEEEDEEDDTDLVNLNHVSNKTIAISKLDQPKELTRREREQKEKKEAQERYWKLHLAGKTDQAKADLARLNQIRKEREEAQAKRKAEAEAKAAEAVAKRQGQFAKGSSKR